MKKFTLLSLSLAALLAPLSVKGQMITASSDDNNGNNALVYSTSPSDPYWAQFGVSGMSSAANLINVESGASPALTVSAITEGDDAVADQTQTTSGITMQYTNGTSPGSSTALVSGAGFTNKAAGVVSVQTGFNGAAPASGQYLSFTVTFNEAVTDGTLNLLGNNYASRSTFSFTFNNGATASINDPDGPPLGGNDNEIYSLSFANVPMGSVLTITDTMTSSLYEPGSAANTSLTGIAFTALDVPEPSTYLMMFSALLPLGLGFIRYRIRAS